MRSRSDLVAIPAWSTRKRAILAFSGEKKRRIFTKEKPKMKLRLRATLDFTTFRTRPPFPPALRAGGALRAPPLRGGGFAATRKSSPYPLSLRAVARTTSVGMFSPESVPTLGHAPRHPSRTTRPTSRGPNTTTRPTSMMASSILVKKTAPRLHHLQRYSVSW